MSKALVEHGYYKKKGTVEKLASKYVAQIQMADSGDVLQARPDLPPESCLSVVEHWGSLPLEKRVLLSITPFRNLASGFVIEHAAGVL